MLLLSVRGDAVDLAYHPADGAVEVGDTFTILDLPERADGVVAQVIATETLDHEGAKGEAIQRILAAQLDTRVLYDRERGMGLIQGIKVARAKIRREVRGGQWGTWAGLTPSRHAAVERVVPEHLLERVVPPPPRAADAIPAV